MHQQDDRNERKFRYPVRHQDPSLLFGQDFDLSLRPPLKDEVLNYGIIELTDDQHREINEFLSGYTFLTPEKGDASYHTQTGSFVCLSMSGSQDIKELPYMFFIRASDLQGRELNLGHLSLRLLDHTDNEILYTRRSTGSLCFELKLGESYRMEIL